MRRLMLTSLLVCLWLAKKGQGDLQDILGQLHTEFAVRLYRQLAETENNSNLIVSPASVAVSLGLLQLGSRGNTLAQLETALGYNVNAHIQMKPNDGVMPNLTPSYKLVHAASCPSVNTVHHGLLITYVETSTCLFTDGLKPCKDLGVQGFLLRMQEDMTNSSHSTRVLLACALFVHRDVQLSPAFARHSSAWANSTVQQANFTRPNRSREQINLWVSTHTAGEIRNLLSCDLTGWGVRQMALVSAMFFRGTWQRQFLLSETQSLPFSLADGSTVKVPMMHQMTDVNFGKYAVVELFYLGDAVSLFVVLPTERKTPLSLIEPHVSAHTVMLWTASLRRTKIDIFLPRFKIQNNLNLKSVLPALGVSDVFNPTVANFKGISGRDSLYVSEATHEAKIEVTEVGTKAAAATAMVLLKRSRAPVFKADRPFLFFLRQSSTGKRILSHGINSQSGENNSLVLQTQKENPC
ncbi:SERP3 protein, partial [Atractosteus spatula]|nr:SERP3 protein [Atractosteus spatula]